MTTIVSDVIIERRGSTKDALPLLEPVMRTFIVSPIASADFLPIQYLTFSLNRNNGNFQLALLNMKLSKMDVL